MSSANMAVRFLMALFISGCFTLQPKLSSADNYSIVDDGIEDAQSGLNGPITDSGNYLDPSPDAFWNTTPHPNDTSGMLTVNDPDDPLVTLAASLNYNPVRIFRWVHDNIAFIDGYSKSRLGAYATYLTRHGNEWDTSSLLIALLRISGYDARYALHGQGDQVSVEALIPQDNYRGHGGIGQNSWTPMVPWHKQYEVTEGIDIFPGKTIPAELDFDFDDYLQSIKNQTVLELYEEKVQAYLKVNHPGKTINDLGRRTKPQLYSSSLPPASYPVTLDTSADKQVFAEIPNEKRASVTVQVKRKSDDAVLLTRTIYLADIATKRLCLDFVPEGDTRLRPVLKLDGVVLQESSISLERNSYFYLTYNGGGFINKARAKNLAGSFILIAFDPLSASIRTVERQKDSLQDLSTSVANDDASREEYLGRMAQILSETYLARYFAISEQVGRIFNGKAGWNRIFPTFIATHPETGSSNVQQSKFLLHYSWTMDTQARSTFYHRQNDQLVKLDWNDPYFTFLRNIASYSASYNEAAVLEDWQDTSSLSTVKGLMLANDDPNMTVRDLAAATPDELAALTNELTALKYRSNFDWDILSDDEWHTIMVFLFDQQTAWGPIPSRDSSDYNTYLGQIKGWCRNGTIPIEHLDHLLTYYIPENSLHDDTIDQIIGYINNGATVKAPLTLLPHYNLKAVFQLVHGTDFDGYYFSLQAGDIPLNGGASSEEVIEDPTYTGWDHVVSDSLDDLTVDDLVRTYSMYDPDKGYAITTGDLGNLVNAVVTKVGNSVDMVNGEFYVQEQPDFHIKSRGLSLAIVRKYKSRAIYNGPFGFGWTWNHGERMMPLANGNLIYYDADGKPQELQKNGPNDYTVPNGSTYTVENISVAGEGWHYLLTRRDFTTYRFNGQGHLIKKEDPFGNYLEFEYTDPDHPERIIALTDSLDRSLTFIYNTDGKVVSITDFSSRSVTYAYDSHDLLSFTDLEGNITSYEYLKNQENTHNDHNLSKYILPNGDAFEIGYYKNDQVAYIRNSKGESFNYLYSRLNQYSETWNESGYYRKVYFDENHNVTRIDNEDGTFVKKTYDEHHNVTSFTDGNGYTTTYDFAGEPELRLLHSKTNALGETWGYQYTSVNNPYRPSQITSPLSADTLFTYWPGGRVRSRVDAAGSTTTYDYDQYGNLTSVTDPLGNSNNFEYDQTGLDLVAKIDANRHITSYNYYQQNNSENMPPGMIRSATIDVAANLSQSGYTITFEYNHYNQLTRATDSLGHETSQEYDQNRVPVKTVAPNGAISRNILDSVRNLTKRADIVETIDPMGNRQHFTYDALGNISSSTDRNGNISRYAYDGMNRLIEETDPFQNSVHYSYDGNGNLIRTVDKNGGTFGNAYDGAGRTSSSTDAMNNTTSYSYNALGLVTGITDASGIDTRFDYDVLGRLVSKTVDHNGTDPRTYSYQHDANHRVIRETLPLDNAITYGYDAKGNTLLVKHLDRYGITLRSTEYVYYRDTRDLVAEVIVDGGKDDSGRGTRFEYDPLGRKVAEIDPFGNRVETVYDEVGNPVFVSTPTGISENIYDLSNRLIQTINPLGETTTWSYDANSNPLSQRDALGNITNIFYDQLNRKIATRDALGHETYFDYDANSNLVQLTDANGGKTLFEYDVNNRTTLEKRPMGQTTQYFYTELGQVSSALYGQGNKVAYQYNGHGQPFNVQYFAPGSYVTPEKTVAYQYDDNGNLVSYSDGTTSADYSYDDLHRRTGETVNYPAFSKSFSYGYPTFWQRTFTGPDGVTTTANYDAAGRMEDLTIPGGGQFSYSDYKWLRPRTVTMPGNNLITMSYDALLRTTGITAMDNLNSQLMLRGYDYSPVGDIEEKITEHGVYSYTYDAMSRLISADNPVLPQGFVSQAPSPNLMDEEFTYDALGNRVTDNAVTGDLQYNLNNELVDIGGTTLTYDLNGNLTDNPLGITLPQKYVYDATKRLKQIKDASQNVVAEYYYDPFGRRLWKDIGGTKTYYLYSNEGLIAEFDNSGNEIRLYGYKPGSSWTTNPLYQKHNGTYYWYINDHLGTPQKMIDTAGNVVWAARYDSFGNAVIDILQVTNNIGFPGQYYDDESGLYYNWNRYYDPTTGRYIQSDPLGLDAGMNFYVYADSNPVRFTDPMGLHTGGYGGPGHGDGGYDEVGSDPTGDTGTYGDEDGDGWYNAQKDSPNHNEMQDMQDDLDQNGGQVTYSAPVTPPHLNQSAWNNPVLSWIMETLGYVNPFAAPAPKNYVEKKSKQKEKKLTEPKVKNPGFIGTVKNVVGQFFGDAMKAIGLATTDVQEIAQTGPPIAKGLLFSAVVVTAPTVAIPAAEVLAPATAAVGTAALANPAAQQAAYEFTGSFFEHQPPSPSPAGMLGGFVGSEIRESYNELFEYDAP